MPLLQECRSDLAPAWVKPEDYRVGSDELQDSCENHRALPPLRQPVSDSSRCRYQWRRTCRQDSVKKSRGSKTGLWSEVRAKNFSSRLSTDEDSRFSVLHNTGAPAGKQVKIENEDIEQEEIMMEKFCEKDNIVESPPRFMTREYKKSSSKRTLYQCNVCGKNFALKDSYLRHVRIHTDERPFTCHVCGKQFRDSGGLSRHLKDVHVGIKNFRCDHCGRSFASKATRDDHHRTHTGERPYVCDSCGKTFRSKASLYIHNKTHSDSFPHACSTCGKSFRRRQEVLAHVTTHTGEKPHACEQCGKGFRVRGELQRHRLIHSDDKPYVCTTCGLNFKQRRYLRNHERARHGKLVTA